MTRLKTILIVDDEPLFLESLVDGLATSADEFRVVTAADGLAATAVLESTPVDLIVTDLKMPHMDGFELLAWLTRAAPTMPVIVMTAFGTPQIEERLAPFEAFRYLEKPIDYQMLADEIREGLRPVSGGHLAGITLSSFLELVQMERKTCTLTVRSGDEVGYLYFQRGELINALHNGEEGEAAAARIVVWREPSIDIENVGRKRRRTINTPLRRILMDAAVHFDEQPAGDDGVLDVAPTLPSPAAPAVAPPHAPAATHTQIVAMLERVQTDVAGFIAASLVELETGATLGALTTRQNVDLSAASTFVAELVKQQIQLMRTLAVGGALQDMLLTVDGQLHMISIITPTRFVHLAADRDSTNLALMRAAVHRHAGVVR
jgi:DNA-binding response OmpR family regulator